MVTHTIIFTEVKILLGLMNFLFERQTWASIETLKHNLTSYRHFFVNSSPSK